MIKVLLFAEMQEKVGSKELIVEESSMTVQDLKDKYLHRYGIDQLLSQSMLAVNEAYEEDDVVLEAGDVVAFIPPVSGG